MDIALRRARLSVAEQPTDDWQGETTAGTDRREGVAQVICAGVPKPGRQCYVPFLGNRLDLADGGEAFEAFFQVIDNLSRPVVPLLPPEPHGGVIDDEAPHLVQLLKRLARQAARKYIADG